MRKRALSEAYLEILTKNIFELELKIKYANKEYIQHVRHLHMLLFFT